MRLISMRNKDRYRNWMGIWDIWIRDMMILESNMSNIRNRSRIERMFGNNSIEIRLMIKRIEINY